MNELSSSQLCDTPVEAYSIEQLLRRINQLVAEMNRRHAPQPGRFYFGFEGVQTVMEGQE